MKEGTAVIKGGKLSTFEGITFVSLVITSKIFYSSTALTLKFTGTAAWYMTLISCSTSMIFFYFIYLLLRRFPNTNISKIYQIVLGKPLGIFLGTIFTGYVVFYTGSSLREFLEMMKTYVLPNTPPSAIVLSFLAVTSLIAYKGMEMLARLSYVSFFPIFLGIITVLFLSYKYFDIRYLTPWQGYGLKNTLLYGFMRSSAYEEVMLIGIITSWIHDSASIKKIGFVSLAIAGATFSISILVYTATFQYTMGKENVSGLFQLSRIVFFGQYFQRIESIFIFVWTISALINISTSFCVSLKLYCQCYNIPDDKPLIMPMAFITYMIAFIPKNLLELLDINMVIIRQYSWPLIYVSSIIILIIALITNKGEKNAW